MVPSSCVEKIEKRWRERKGSRKYREPKFLLIGEPLRLNPAIREFYAEFVPTKALKAVDDRT
jgi:hypothetical protein